MSEVSARAFEEFDALAKLFGRTRIVLHDVMAHGDMSPAGSSMLASETLPHIEDVETGFKAQLRSSAGDVEELRSLVLHGGLAVPEPRDDPEVRAALIEAMQALSGAGGPRDLVAPAGRDLAALDHARIAMAMLPQTQAQDVHYPGRPSYLDIAAPRSPGEFAARIEEVERTIWRVAAGRRSRTNRSQWRRVYAFFDAGERLSTEGLLPA
jgi:hypothetical protein